jgi:hypothetical protein
MTGAGDGDDVRSPSEFRSREGGARGFDHIGILFRARSEIIVMVAVTFFATLPRPPSRGLLLLEMR